uniref:NADH:ubiquinone reductase (H(+)-translocating) n=1 Tax=Harpactocrates apennicola TaxID=1110479 RepID=A0A516IMD0_9ARAC|nr:NADH dehydrogenase subunit 5 [Harpactocrates apennicola]QDP17924.1 NADH dehydrogenase subunit 5 [Harpactocrates apennicola]
MNKNFILKSIPILCMMLIMAIFYYKIYNKMIMLNYTMLLMYNMNIQLNLLMDWMTLLFSLTVMMITYFIFIFSMSYIPKKEHLRFYLLTSLFVSSMLTLILSNNLIMLLMGWDGLGLSSYILVIYYQNASTNSSGTITILSNRLGDIMLLLSFATLASTASWHIFTNFNFPLITTIFMLIAAISKSAQFPFSAWLPAAMAAPTPISALVHSSTLVTAGVYLMIRLSSSFHPISMFLLMIIAIFTILYSSMAANWEQDMKKIIALSTLSQMSIMMFAIALNAYFAAFFHMITHALFKSTMFMCAGNIIHNSNYQDMRSMCSMFNKTPILSTSMGISSMALMGLPFTAGFFSKDAIITFMMTNSTNLILIMLMLLTIGMTTFYSTRMMSQAMNMKMKSKPDILISNDWFLTWPAYLMLPLSLTTGMLLSWFSIPTQTLILPTQNFILILLMIFSGFALSMSISYKSNLFNLIGLTSISMWFMHPTTTNPWIKTSTLSPFLLKMDNSWLEQLSAQGMFLTLKNSMMVQKMSLKNTFTLIVLTSLIPIYLI